MLDKGSEKPGTVSEAYNVKTVARLEELCIELADVLSRIVRLLLFNVIFSG
jgi:hypothetical protein